MKDKITGEEKHYQKLNNRLTKSLKQVTEERNKAYSGNFDFHRKVLKLEKELANITEENGLLRTKLNLTEDEVKQIVSASKNINSFGDLMSVFSRPGY